MTAGAVALTAQCVVGYGDASTLVEIDRSSTSGAIRRGLIGLSYEKQKLATRFFAPSNSALIAYFKNLGPGVLRIGANTADRILWDPKHAGAIAYRTAPSAIDDLAAFLRATDWRAIYALNFATNTPDAAAAEAAYVSTALDRNLLSFEIGNESDCYSKNGLRPVTYSVSQFINEWASFARTINRHVPNARISGPSSSHRTDDWTLPFAASQGSKLSQLTEHYYRGNGKGTEATMGLLLANDHYLQRLLIKLSHASKLYNIPDGFRLTETNSLYSGGADKISNTHGAALWTVDLVLTNARYGSAGVNLHGGGNGTYNAYYTPLADTPTEIRARPVYYGLLFVAQIADGVMFDTKVTSSLNISAYAVAGADGCTYVVLNNKDPQRASAAIVKLGTVVSRATALTLAGSSLGTLSGTTIGGATVDDSGYWSRPSPRALLLERSDEVSITLSPASAMLIKAS